jgi:hypothetical protein
MFLAYFSTALADDLEPKNTLDMDGEQHANSPPRISLPFGWLIADRFEGSMVTVLVFQRDGAQDIGLTAVCYTFQDALAHGLDRIPLFEERERQRRQR